MPPKAMGLLKKDLIHNQSLVHSLVHMEGVQ